MKTATSIRNVNSYSSRIVGRAQAIAKHLSSWKTVVFHIEQCFQLQEYLLENWKIATAEAQSNSTCGWRRKGDTWQYGWLEHSAQIMLNLGQLIKNPLTLKFTFHSAVSVSGHRDMRLFFSYLAVLESYLRFYTYRFKTAPFVRQSFHSTLL